MNEMKNFIEVTDFHDGIRFLLPLQGKRFALDEWTELTSGSPVEIKICGSWVKTHIEHDGTDYYAVGLRGLKLDGLEARIPERG